AGGTVTDLRGNGAVIIDDPVDVTAELTGQGDSIAVVVTGEAGGMPVNGTGRLDLADLGGDEPLLIVDVGPVVGLEVRPGGLRGAGELEGLEVGPLAVPDLPWSFQATWSDGVTGSVSVAGSSVDLALDGDELVVSGPLTLPARYAGEEIVATVSVPGGRVPLANV